MEKKHSSSLKVLGQNVQRFSCTALSLSQGCAKYNIKIVELDYEGKAFVQKKEQPNLEKNLDF